ncbi:MAG: Hpt domain-containing protein, partial [Coleofasciculus sp. S288]|nr:Hpt domain-containing protein [Coleofasciculus sp. S288]
MMIEDEELRHLYITTSEERLQKLEVGLQHLQKHPDDEALLEELRREAHSLKGDSRSLGIEMVETVAYQLEEILASIKHQQTVLTPLLSDRLNQGLAVIGLLVQEAVTGQPSGIDTDNVLLQLMEAVLESQVPQQDATFAAQKAPQLAPTFIEDEELRNLYVTASEERLHKLEVGFRHLQKHPDDKAVLEELRREAHSLKGDSRSVGLETVEALAHQLEEILGRIRRQQAVLTPQVSDRVYQALAAISLLVQETATGQLSGVESDG